jgi:hypothetical protein
MSNGQRLRRSAPFNKLCSFYGLDASPTRRRYNDLLRDAIVDAWDGSDEHGRALLVVIQGLKDLQSKTGDG